MSWNVLFMRSFGKKQMVLNIWKHFQMTPRHRYIFWVSVCAYASWALHPELSRAKLTCIQSCLALPQHCCCSGLPFPHSSLSLSSCSPLPLTAAGRQAGRADGILASRMTLVFLPLVLILQSWLSKPNPTLARAAGPLPALLLSTQRLFIGARVLANSSAYIHCLCAITQLLSSILVHSSLLLLLLTYLLHSTEILCFNNVHVSTFYIPLFLSGLLQDRLSIFSVLYFLFLYFIFYQFW